METAEAKCDRAVVLYNGALMPLLGRTSIFGIRNIRSHDGTFVLGTIRSLEHSFPGLFVPWNFCSRYPGPFLPRTVRAFVSRAVPVLEQRNKQKHRPMTATVHSRCTHTVDRKYSTRDVNKARGSKAKACQFNPRPGQGQGLIP